MEIRAEKQIERYSRVICRRVLFGTIDGPQVENKTISG